MKNALFGTKPGRLRLEMVKTAGLRFPLPPYFDTASRIDPPHFGGGVRANNPKLDGSRTVLRPLIDSTHMKRPPAGMSE